MRAMVLLLIFWKKESKKYTPDAGRSHEN